MSRQIRLYPGSDPNILSNSQPGLNFSQHDQSRELWIDINSLSYLKFDHPVFCGIEKVFFYDFFHAPSRFSQKKLKTIQETSERYPTVWMTANAKETPGIICHRYDYVWNRTKISTLDKSPEWKQCSDHRCYIRSSLKNDFRKKKYLSLNRTINPYRKKLIEFLSTHDGYLSHVGAGRIIGNEYTTDSDIRNGITVPPAPGFFDDSYVSCQVESQYLGDESVIFTEKTYEHLIRGRIVLNFGPRDFYRCLENDGWKLPREVDLSWDSEKDDDLRFDGYLSCLRSIFEKKLTDIHDWFIGNNDVIEHNYQMLEIKPYDRLQ